MDDNGVGMAQAILTTDLLDFGRSFWASERAAREFPGVHASGYTPIGRFGIGFFSIFMAAKKVNVYSRRFDKGLDEVRRLSFEKGISLRPTLSFERPDDWGMDLCTRVELELEPGVVRHPSQFTIRCNLQGHEDFDVTFEDYVGSVALAVIAGYWRANPPTWETTLGEIRKANHRTLALLDERDLLIEQPSDTYSWIFNEWQFPMYELNLKAIDVDPEELRQQQQNWCPEC